MLTKAEIQAAQDAQRETVNVPEWGGALIVRGLTGNERDDYEKTIMVMKKRDLQMNIKGARARLVVMTVINEDGSLMFEPGDVSWLGEKSARALNRVTDVAMMLSGITEDDIEELAGDFTQVPVAGEDGSPATPETTD